MEWFQALILGIIQGLTEFLPVSSSGHLEIGKALLGVEVSENITFTVVVHGATVLSTLIVFRDDIIALIKNIFTFEWNESNKYTTKLLISMIPVGIVGVLFKDSVENLFNGNLLLVGAMLILTALLLLFTNYAKESEKKISFIDALIIGISQAIAVIPGISRSGATISTALLLKNKKSEAARFSFLMVLIPVIGANILDLKDMDMSSTNTTNLIIGFIAAFTAGYFACRWMIEIIKKQKLIYFSAYCAIVGLIAVTYSLLQ